MSAFTSFLRPSIALAFATIALVTSDAARGADVIFYAVAKDEGFDQSGAGPPASKGNPFRFNATVGLTTANSVSSATVRMLPSGPVYPLVAGTYSFDFQAKFSTLAALNAAARNGNYQIVINSVHDGAPAISLPLNGDAYPSTDPHISNFTAAQTINPAISPTAGPQAFPIASTAAGLSIEPPFDQAHRME